MRRGRVALLLLLFLVGCSGSKPSVSTPDPTPAPSPAPDEVGRADQNREDAALNQKASLRVGRASEHQAREQLEDDVRKVDDFLARFQGTKAAEDVAVWRAEAGKVLEKWQAEDRKARAEPVNVPLAVLLSEFRKDKAAADAKYRRKWLVVSGTVTGVTRGPIGDWSAGGASYTALVPPKPRADVVALIVKLRDKPGADEAIECRCVVATRAGPGGVEQGKGLAAVKEGDAVTILGKWLSPFPPLVPPGSFARTTCALDQCELAK